jgi:hypothetical protein
LDPFVDYSASAAERRRVERRQGEARSYAQYIREAREGFWGHEPELTVQDETERGDTNAR